MIGKIAESIAQGRGMVGVSLPVKIFEGRSMLERICDQWCFAPQYLEAAGQQLNPIDRMKNVIAFAFAGLTMSVSQLKPFNPLLGETYQGQFEGGGDIFVEHTSHHPPISNFYVEGQNYIFSGRYETVPKPNATYNVICVYQEGLNVIKFKNNEQIEFELPGAQLSGMIMGDRLSQRIGMMNFIDRKNKLKAIIKFGEKSKGFFSGKVRQDVAFGKIYSYDDTKNAAFFQNQIEKKEYEDVVKQDIKQELCNIQGSILQNLIFDQLEVWNINKDHPSVHQATTYGIPSDSRYREDIIWLKYGNHQFSEKWKLRLEERQRFERKLRQENAKTKK